MGLLGRWQLSLLQSVRNERRGCLSARARSVARICTDAARADTNLVIDAAGPETLTFDELVALIRRATGARALIVHVPVPIMGLAARALGLLVRDVVLTPDEVDGLMAGLLVSNDPPLGEVRISEWLDQSKTSVGRTYANELQRHFVCQHDNR